MKDYLKLFAIYVIRFILHGFYFLPIKKNRVIFFAYNGKQFSCNPKYIYQSLFDRYPGQFECIWALKEPSRHTFDGRETKTVRYGSLAFVFYIMTSKVIVANTGVPSYIPYRSRQFVINTWHGGGAYKRVSADITKNFAELETIRYIARHTSAFLSGCTVFSDVMSQATKVGRERMWEIGMPRNDHLFLKPHDSAQLIREHYHLPSGCKLVLYAPTFRGGVSQAYFSNQISANKCLRAMADRFGGEWYFLYRAHNFVSGSAGNGSAGARDVSDYDDMQVLLSAVDVLITDYSSSMWDFSLTGKPCLIFAPDLDEYRQERDFYTPVSEWPFPVARTNEELSAKIRAFDENDYELRVEKHHQALGIRESGHASDTAADKINEVCFGEAKQE